MDREALWATAHGVPKSWTWLRYWAAHSLLNVSLHGPTYPGFDKGPRNTDLLTKPCTYPTGSSLLGHHLEDLLQIEKWFWLPHGNPWEACHAWVLLRSILSRFLQGMWRFSHFFPLSLIFKKSLGFQLRWASEMSTTGWHLLWACHLPRQGLSHEPLQLMTSKHPEGVQGGEQKWGPLFSSKLAGQVFSS